MDIKFFKISLWSNSGFQTEKPSDFLISSQPFTSNSEVIYNFALLLEMWNEELMKEVEKLQRKIWMLAWKNCYGSDENSVNLAG